MNLGRLIGAIFVAFLFIFGSDYLIHAIWLAPDYKATESLWRSEPEMHRRFIVLVAAQFLCALSFMYVWARTGWRRRRVIDGAVFGFWLGVFQQVMTIVTYVVTYLPFWLALKWLGAGMAQAIVLGVIAATVYKPQAILGDARS